MVFTAHLPSFHQLSFIVFIDFLQTNSFVFLRCSFFLCKIAGVEAISRDGGCDIILQSAHGIDKERLCKF